MQLIYNKYEGLNYANFKPDNSTQLDIISDPHLDFYIDNKNESFQYEVRKVIEEALSELESKAYEVLIVAGDISHKNKVSKEFLVQLSEIWKFVLVIPGNHDWYLQDKNHDRYGDLILSLNHVDNIVFLMDKIEIFEYKGIKIGGTIMFYNLNEMTNYIRWKSTMNDKRFLSREFINERNAKDVEYYNKVIHDLDIFISHVPIVNLEGVRGMNPLFLNSDVNPVSGVLYISGHTHKRVTSIDRKIPFDAVNVSYGYPSETSVGLNLITSIFVMKEEE